MSRSIPFLQAPTITDNYPGDVQFDPLGFSSMFDIKWLREAEIKHCRVAMLAALGFSLQQYVHLPMWPSVEDANMAPQVVGLSAMMQIVAMAGVEEWRTNNGNITMETMFNDPNRVPGDIGFGKR